MTSHFMFPVGAAFYGASISSQFKTKNIKVQDVIPYDIQVSYIAESKLSGMFHVCYDDDYIQLYFNPSCCSAHH